MKRILALSVTLLLLAGCGGGGGGSSSAPGAPAKGAAQTGSVVIFIPNGTGQSGSSKVRYPQFVSPNASSVAMNINGGADTLFNVAAGSSLCVTVTTGRNCTLAFSAPVGSDTFGFLIFAGANGTGTQLASATTTQAIASGQAFNFAVALNAAVGTIVVNFAFTHGAGGCPDGPIAFNGINEGCPGGAPFTVSVDDPSGALISGTTPYATPISITGNDPSLSATPNQFTAPGQTVTLSYTGAAFASTITNQAVVTLTAGGQTAQLTLPILRQYLYIANSNASFGSPPSIGGGNVVVYQYGATGSTPARTLSGTNTGLVTPTIPLVDTSGNLYVLDNGIPISTTYNPSIKVFGPGATGNVTPIRQITNMGPVMGNTACSDMIFDPTGNFLFLACGTQTYTISAATSGPPTVTATFFNECGDAPAGMAFDQSGNFYTTDTATNSIDLYGHMPTSGGFVMSCPNGSMDGGTNWPATIAPYQFVIDNSGTLYAPLAYQNATGGAPDAVAELGIWKTSTLCNNCGASATLIGAPFITHAIFGITLDSAGTIYLMNPFTGLVSEIAATTLASAGVGTNNAPILRTLSDTSTSAIFPVGMAIGP